MELYQALITLDGWTFLAQICNLMIQLFIFKKFLLNPVKNVIAERKAKADSQIADATKLRTEAEAMKAEYEQNLQNARAEAGQIVAAAQKTAAARGEELLGEARAQAAALKQKAEADIAQERKKAVNEVKDEIGGGACQVSSTLYAATLFSFLETVERECHYFPVNYMQMGTDATVTIPEGGGRSIDFKFRNSRNYPIKLVGIFNNEESTLTFEIWGTLEDDDYMPVEFDSSYSWVYDFDKFIDPAYPDRDGYTIKLTHETYSFEDDVGLGYRTLTHRQVIDADGNIVVDEITNTKLSNGNYAMDTYYQHN